MSEDKVEGTQEEPGLPGIRCNEGPPQIVPVAAIPLPVKVVQPGSMPPMRFELRTMRPVMGFEKPGCGRHYFSDSVDLGTQKICGNCKYGIPIEIPREEEEEEKKETGNKPKLIKG